MWIYFFQFWIKAKEETSRKRFSALREHGATQMESVRTLIIALHIPLLEADRIILESIAWKDKLESTEEFRDHFGALLDQFREN